MSKFSWDNLRIKPEQWILDVIADFEFEKMTPVQAATIPLLLDYKDVAVEAVTGSGKTLAFVVPMLEILNRRSKETPWKENEVGAIIISPTRELATQTSKVLKPFLNHCKLTQRLLVGGNSVEEDVHWLRKHGSTILICTPGRLLDLLERRGELNLAGRVRSLEILILDEADRLLNLGFTTTINTILEFVPRLRRTGLFSATQTKEVQDLMRAGLRNPVTVTVLEKEKSSTPALLRNYYTVVEPEEKLSKLIKFIEKKKIRKAMIFFPTCACVEYWAHIFPEFFPNRTILTLHGKMKNRRIKVLDKFRKLNNVLLLCTDLLARGIDIPEMDWVLQWEPPSNAASFVHRVGRTARQGHDGNALMMLLPSEVAYVDFLQRNQKVLLKKIKITDNQSVDSINERIYQIQLSNRAIFDKSNIAFVSHVRAYSKHECNYLLRVSDLNLGKIATGYGLLKMPLMPELKSSETGKDFCGPSNVDLSTIPYVNKSQEKERKKKLEIYRQTGEWPGKKKFRKSTESWSMKKQQRAERKVKRDKRKTKKELKKSDPKNLRTSNKETVQTEQTNPGKRKLINHVDIPKLDAKRCKI